MLDISKLVVGICYFVSNRTVIIRLAFELDVKSQLLNCQATYKS